MTKLIFYVARGSVVEAKCDDAFVVSAGVIIDGVVRLDIIDSVVDFEIKFECIRGVINFSD